MGKSENIEGKKLVEELYIVESAFSKVVDSKLSSSFGLHFYKNIGSYRKIIRVSNHHPYVLIIY